MVFGQIIRSFPVIDGTPTDLVRLGGRIINGGQGADQYYMYDLRGNLIRRFDSPNVNPLGLDSLGGGRFIASWQNPNRIGILDNEFQLLRSRDTINVHDNIATDGKYVYSYDRATGEFLAYSMALDRIRVVFTVTPPTTVKLRGMKIMNGRIYHTDENEDLLRIRDLGTGTILRSAASPGTLGYGIGLDGKYLWHSDFGTDRIYQMSLQ